VALGGKGGSARQCSLTEALGKLVGWRREETAKWSGTNFRLITRVIRQAISGAELDREEDSTQLWMEVLMRCFVGAQLRVQLVLG